MELEIICTPSAFKHGIGEADIRNAFKRRLFDNAMPGEEHKNLLIGLNRSGNPLEIIYNVPGDEIIKVFHAMKLRKAYYGLLKQTGAQNE